MVLLGPNPAPLAQTSLAFGLWGLLVTISKGKTDIREEKHLDTLIYEEEMYWMYIFSLHQNLAQGTLRSTERFQFILTGSESNSKD